MPCRLEDYGLIGDCETAALVGRDGSIDWLCWPAFDSDACFAAILGTHKNVRWLIAPGEDITGISRRYLGNTLILETRFETRSGAVALIDFMPPRGKASDIVRLVRGLTGTVKMRMELVIRFGFGVDIPWVRRIDHSLLAIAGQYMTVLRTPVETRGRDVRGMPVAPRGRAGCGARSRWFSRGAHGTEPVVGADRAVPQHPRGRCSSSTRRPAYRRVCTTVWCRSHNNAAFSRFVGPPSAHAAGTAGNR